MAVRNVEVLLIVSGLDVNGKESDTGRGDGPGKLYRVVTIEMLKEREKGIIAMSP
jgi:hypothetical protein